MKTFLFSGRLSHPKKKLSSAIVALALLGGASTAYSAQLEEVIVTAQKRAQSLQDVPISVAAMSGDKIQSSGMEGLSDLTVQMPNITITEAAAGDQMFIRGIGSGINPGFEQSVGTFIDGVYFGRGRQSVSSFMDIELVEVLKGPQSTYFGNNTIAGAINITTQKPTGDFEGYVSGLHEFNHGESDVQFGFGGPVSDQVGYRIAGRYREIDGWVENTFLDRDEAAKESWALRGTLQYTNDTLEAIVRVEGSDLEEDGNLFQAVMCPGVGGAVGFPGCAVALGFPQFEDRFDEDKQDGAAGPFPNPTFDPDNMVHEQDTFNASLTLNYDLDGSTLTSITAFASYDDFRNNIDVDFTPRAGIVSPRTEEYEQISQEIRLVSPGDETIDYIVGVYYQTSELELRDQFSFGAIPVGGGSVLDHKHNQDEESYALFSAIAWNISDEFSVTLGLRYTEVEKEVDGVLTAYELDNVTPQDASGLGFLNPRGFFSTPAYDLDDTYSDFTPSLNLQWHVTGDMMVYFTYAQGFKAGGFDGISRSDGSDPVRYGNTISFNSEEVDSYEIGMKTTLLDGAMNLNLALFRAEYSELQVSTFDGVGGFLVGNAGESVTQGLEGDIKWAATDELTLGLSFSFLDSEYEEFDGQQCRFDSPNPSAVIPGTCDLTGESLIFSPDWSGVFNLDYVMPIASDLELSFGLDVVFTDEFFTAADNDPNTMQDAYEKIDARIAIGDQDGVWQVALVGKNLTDEFTTSQSNDLPQGGGSYFALLERTRSIALQAKYSF